jgi:hypothetical protein
LHWASCWSPCDLDGGLGLAGFDGHHDIAHWDSGSTTAESVIAGGLISGLSPGTV